MKMRESVNINSNKMTIVNLIIIKFNHNKLFLIQ